MKPSDLFRKPAPGLCLLLAVLAAPVLAQNRVFQWTDGNGVVHYSDTARSGARPVTIRQRGDTGDGAVATTVDPQACLRKREELQRYSSASKVTETNALGESRDYDEVQIRKLVETAAAAVRAACGES